MNEPERKKLPEPMDEFERALTRALRRVDVPESFAARVVERAGTGEGRSVKVVTMRSRWAGFRMQAWVGGALAALLVLGVFGVEEAHVREQRERTALAQQQFETATRITDHALEQVRAQLKQAGVLQYE